MLQVLQIPLVRSRGVQLLQVLQIPLVRSRRVQLLQVLQIPLVRSGGSTVASGPSDSTGQIRGSTVASGPSDSAGVIQEGTGSQERGAIQEGTGSQERGAVGLRPLVDGGSVPVSNFQQGGSSGSHGMQADPLPDLCYEDYFGDAMSVERFPYVGSWLQIHYMMHVFSQAGEQVLWALGERSVEWLALRCVSGGIKCAVSLVVVEVLRRGPNHLLYSGPQWLAAVDEFFLSGQPVLGVSGQVPEETAPAASALRTVGFPYIEGPPGVVVHYLWRVFMLVGWAVLDYLGDRVSSWAQLRATAVGFRSGTTLAVIVWLRRTYQLYVANAQDTYDAAEGYIREGVVRYPFAGQIDQINNPAVNEIPLRPAVPGLPPRVGYEAGFNGLLEGSSSSEGRSTTEPSVEILSASIPPEVGEVELEEGANVASSGPGRNESSATVYEARLGLILVRCGDDVYEVPLEGWCQEAIEGVVQSLNSGDWTRYQAGLEAGGFSQPSSDSRSSVESSQGLPSPSGGPLQVRIGVWMRIFIVWWVLIQSAGAADGSDLNQVVLWESPRGTTCEASEGPCIRLTDRGRDFGDNYGFWLEGLVLVSAILGSWEMLRALGRRCRRSQRVTVDRGTQTDLLFVPLPFEVGVLHRDRILYCLWRAGYPIDITEYDEETQDGYHGLVGDYLLRLERAEPSESD